MANITARTPSFQLLAPFFAAPACVCVGVGVEATGPGWVALVWAATEVAEAKLCITY